MHWLDIIHSTNDWASARLRSVDHPALREPELVVAGEQSAGRGRLGRPWHSDRGTLTATFVLPTDHLQPDPQLWPQVALVAGLAVCQAIEEMIGPIRASLKWPNDVLVDHRKVAGVLSEYISGSNPAVLVGIGVNVATDFQNAPAELQQRAGSLSAISRRPLDRWHYLHLLCGHFADCLTQWRQSPIEAMRACGRRCALTGHQIQAVTGGGEILQGVCQGIDDFGQLHLQTDRGEQRIRSAEVSRVR
jgi:BirA family biotin operon repressor/biotin-[acetyl-CoA-carboxylase] ligase